MLLDVITSETKLEFLKLLGIEIINGKIVDTIEYRSRKRGYAIEKLEKDSIDKSAEELLSAKMKIYLDSAYEMDKLVRELLEEKDKYVKEMESFLEEVREYRKNYYKKNKKYN